MVWKLYFSKDFSKKKCSTICVPIYEYLMMTKLSIIKKKL